MLHVLSLVCMSSTFKSFTPSFYDAVVDRINKLQHSAWLQGRQVLKKGYDILREGANNKKKLWKQSFTKFIKFLLTQQFTKLSDFWRESGSLPLLLPAVVDVAALTYNLFLIQQTWTSLTLHHDAITQTDLSTSAATSCVSDVHLEDDIYETFSSRTASCCLVWNNLLHAHRQTDLKIRKGQNC